jgi:hypothetical protein
MRRLIDFLALTTIGLAGLAVWGGPAAAADPVPLPDSVQPPTAPAPASEAAAPATPAAPALDDAAPAPAPEVAPPQTPDPSSTVSGPVQTANGAVDAAPTAPAAVQTQAPADVAAAATQTIDRGPSAPTISVDAAAAKPVSAHTVPIDVKQTSTSVAHTAPSPPDPVSAPSPPGPPPASSRGDDRDGREFLPLPGALAPPTTLTVHRLPASDGISEASLLGLLAGDLSAPASGESAPAPETLRDAGSAPGLPGLPSPLQVLLTGSASGSGSSTGFFLFGFAALLAGLIATAAPALSRRLVGSPARCRPVPHLALLERPG